MTDAAIWHKIDQLETDLARLRARVPLRPAPTASRTVRVCVVMGGNLINPGAVTGISYAAAAPASIPDYDAAAIPSTVDGVGIAYDPMTGDYLLIANYTDASIFAGLVSPRDYFAGELILIGPTTTLPVTAGGGATRTLSVIIGVG